MYNTYILFNKTKNKIYIGHTADLVNRLKRHNQQLPSKKKSYTYKNKGNWKVVYKEEFNTRIEATKREKELKSFQGRKFIREKILESVN